MNPVLGMLPKFAGVFKSIGRAARIVSPIAREVGNVGSNFVPEKNTGESKLKQLASSVGSFAMTQSPILSEAVDALGTLGYIFGKKGGDGDSNASSSEDRSSLPGPGATEAKAKTDPRGQNNVVLEYLTDGNNQYMKAFGSVIERLDTISGTLRKQLDFTQKLVGINQKILKANEELKETNRAKTSLDTVERKNSARERAKNQPRDEFGRFMSPAQENVESNDGGGGLLDKLLKGAGGAAAFGFLKRGMRSLSGGIGNAFKSTGRLLRSAGGGISSLFSRSTATAAAQQTAKTVATQQAARVGTATAAKRSIPRMLSGLFPRLAGPAGVAAAILEPSELGVDPQEEFRSSIFRKLGNEGVSALPEIREMLNSEQGQFVRETFPSPEYDILLNDDAKAREFARSILNSVFSTDRKRSSEVFYGDTNSTINRMIQDYTRDGDGVALSPDMVRSKIASSPAVMRTQSNLDMINGAVSTAAAGSGGPVGAPPVIVNNQGGPTNVNNGGNITTVIMGGSSLELPQSMYNLPSGVN